MSIHKIQNSLIDEYLEKRSSEAEHLKFHLGKTKKCSELIFTFLQDWKNFKSPLLQIEAEKIVISGNLGRSNCSFSKKFWNEITCNGFFSLRSWISPAILKFHEKAQAVPIEIQKNCADSLGKNLHAVVAAVLLTDLLNYVDSEEFHLRKILEFVFIKNESLMDNSQNYLINLGLIINRIIKNNYDNLKDKFTLKSVEKILNNTEKTNYIVERDDSLLSISKEEFEIIKNNYNPNFHIPKELYDKDDQYRLRLMLFMTSLNEETRTDCIRFYIKQMENEILTIKPPKNYALFSLLAYLPEKQKIEILQGIIQDPKKIKLFIRSHLTFSKVMVQWNESTGTRADALLEKIFSIIPMTHLKEESSFSKEISQIFENKKNKSETIVEKTKPLIIENHDVICGRTVIKDKKYAYKILKKEEELSSFQKEFETLKILRKNEFKSLLPNPKNIYKRSVDKSSIQLELNEEPTAVPAEHFFRGKLNLIS